MPIVDGIEIFNGVVIKISGAGCLLGLIDNGEGNSLATLGFPEFFEHGAKPNIRQFRLDGKEVEPTITLDLSTIDKIYETGLDQYVKKFLMMPPKPDVNTRLTSCKFIPDLSSLYENPNLKVNKKIRVNWPPNSHKIELLANYGEICAFNLLKDLLYPARTQKIKISNKINDETGVKKVLDYVAENFAFALKFDPSHYEGNDELVFRNSSNSKSQDQRLSYTDNLFTLIEIFNPVPGPENEDRLKYYYDKCIITYNNSDISDNSDNPILIPIPNEERLYRSPIDNGVSGLNVENRAIGLNVYCSPIRYQGE